MTTPFGPQLIGQTEKTLVALLSQSLEGTGLSEPQWVTLRVAAMLEDSVDAGGLLTAVADRARFPDAAEIVRHLTTRGLLDDGRLTAAGRDLIETVLTRSESRTGTIWRDLPAQDVAATTFVLNEVLRRARAVLQEA
jgi:hypothetical protein